MEYPSAKKVTKTLHHALHAMMQFSVIFHPQTKKINSFFKSMKIYAYV
jgi:hypothetical protein